MIESSEAKMDCLARSAMFESLPTDDRATVLRLMTVKQFHAGQSIFLSGEDADGLYVLLSGGVGLAFSTSDDRVVSHCYASVGAVFGEIATLDGGKRTAEASALTDVDCLWLTGDGLDEALRTIPSFAPAIIRFLCARVREADDKVEALVLQSIEAKLARFLLLAVEARTRGPVTGHVPITLSISPSELSMLVGGTNANIGAALSHLEANAVITLQDDAIVCDPSKLRRVVGNG